LGRVAVLIASKPLGAVALAVIFVFVFSAIFAPLIAPYAPRVASGPNFDPPNLAHPFGTDFAGRDILSRIIYGARVSLYVGIGAVLIGTLAGTVLGLLSGFFGGAVEMLIQRIVDAAMAIPLILLAVVIVSLVPPSLNNIVVALSFAIAPRTARVVHSATLAVRHELFIEAARSVGCTPMRILWRHVLPNVLAPIIVVASVIMGGAIIAESSLSFLGLSDPGQISWGAMLSGEGRQFMIRAPWSAIFPGAAIMLTVLAFNLVGDALRDVLDPRLRI
jgi:ABC-type dipeptide/oligopeptide/nickel transport system permease subunit